MNRSTGTVIAIIAILASQCVVRETKAQGKPAAAPAATKYDKMAKRELQEELKRLQKEVLTAERAAEQAKKESEDAVKAYKLAGENQKGDVLLRMIEAEAKCHKPLENAKQLNADFAAAKNAYLNLLVAEQK